jgi:hypothetical protein
VSAIVDDTGAERFEPGQFSGLGAVRHDVEMDAVLPLLGLGDIGGDDQPRPGQPEGPGMFIALITFGSAATTGPAIRTPQHSSSRHWRLSEGQRRRWRVELKRCSIISESPGVTYLPKP